MTTQAQTPQQPLPSPPAHGRHRAASDSSFSSLSTASSTPTSPSPSPRTTSVPFSWEHHPGIPKNCFPADPAASPPTPLPLPPPLRAPPSRHRRRRANNPQSPGGALASDPFAAALAECTRERNTDSVIDKLFPPTPPPASAVTTGCHAGRRWSIATGGVVGFLDLYGCKSAMAVADGAFVVRRPVAVARPGSGRPGQGRAGRPGRR